MRRFTRTGIDVTSIGLAAVLAGVLSFAMAWRMLAPTHRSDYPAHVGFAKALEGGALPIPHVLFQAAVIGVRHIMPEGSYELAAAVVTMLSSVALAILLVVLASHALEGRGQRARRLGPPAIAIALLLVAPITIFSWPRHQYLGYVGIAVYHNPTVILLRPLALVLFYVALGALSPAAPSTRRALAGAGILSVAAALAKPSYTICLVPALLLWTAARTTRSRPVDSALLAAIVVPAVVVLATQYMTSSGNVSIVFAPLVVVTHYVARRTVPWRLALSVLFPATMYVLYFRVTRHRRDLNFAWLVFLVGAGLFYCAAEPGERIWHANLAWGAQVSLFVLFVVSLLFLTSDGLPARRGWARVRLLLTWAVLLLHVASGVVWYAAQLRGPAPAFW